ncbi:MAG: hypothetical protein QM777_20880, partial [Pseudorhodoferax sp.]
MQDLRRFAAQPLQHCLEGCVVDALGAQALDQCIQFERQWVVHFLGRRLRDQVLFGFYRVSLLTLAI